MDPAAISTGMGEGEAQVFKPQESLLPEALKMAGEKKKESAANKAQAMATLNKMAEYHVWTQRDGDEFAKLQKGVWDGLQGKDLDDPATMLWLNQKQQELTYKADKSNTDKEAFVNATKQIAATPNKYFPDTGEYLLDYANPKNAFGDFDVTKMSQRADLDTDLKKIADLGRSRAEANKQKLAQVTTIPGSSAPYTVETTTTEYPLKEAEQDIRIQMQEPSWRKTVNERWQTDPNKNKYSTVDEYAQFELAPKIASKSSLQDASRVPDGNRFGGGGGFTPGGWSVNLQTAEKPALAGTEMQEAASKLAKQPDYIEKYNVLATAGKLPQVKIGAGKERDQTIEEFALEGIQNSPTAQTGVEGFTFDFNRASKSGEPAEIGTIMITGDANQPGVAFKPTTISFGKSGEPMVTGLDSKGKTQEVPYSQIHAQLKNETGGDWNILKQKMIDQVGFDPFSQYESKKAPAGKSSASGGAKATTNAKRDAAGNTYGDGSGKDSPLPFQGKDKLIKGKWYKNASGAVMQYKG
jgi:hypothetical protein